jgi:hypothetical protein
MEGVPLFLGFKLGQIGLTEQAPALSLSVRVSPPRADGLVDAERRDLHLKGREPDGQLIKIGPGRHVRIEHQERHGSPSRSNVSKLLRAVYPRGVLAPDHFRHAAIIRPCGVPVLVHGLRHIKAMARPPAIALEACHGELTPTPSEWTAANG